MGPTELPPAIIQQESGELKLPKGFVSLEVLNGNKNKIIIDLIKKDLLGDGTPQNRIDELKFGVVGDIGVLIVDGNPLSFYKYSKNNGVEFYINFSQFLEYKDLQFGLKEAGYEIKDGKLFKKGKEIPEFLSNGNISPEFIGAIDDINFFVDIQGVFGMIKAIREGYKLKTSKLGYLNFSIVSGVVRIKDVMFFYSEGYIPEEDFLILLKRAILELPNQCNDLRFYKNANGERMGMEVTKDELEQYLKPEKGLPLITQSMYDDCLKRIQKRDKYIEEAEKRNKEELEEIKRTVEESTIKSMVQEVLYRSHRK